MTSSVASPAAAAKRARAELARRELLRRQHRGDPAGWIRERLGEHPWSKQVEILEAVREHRHVTVQSAHGTGKDWTAARLVAWWIDVHPVGEAFVVASAPTTAQLGAILFREIGKAHRAGGLSGQLSGGIGTVPPSWRIGDEIVAYGRKPADYTDADQAASQFQGIHSRYPLIVLDEAGGIPEWLWDATETLVTNEDARILAIGNPTSPSGRFAKVCAPGSGWHVIKISAYDAPAFTREPVPEALEGVLVSKLWVDERRKRWGEGSPQWQSRVLGEFPEIGDDTLIAPKWIVAAQERELEPVATDSEHYGVDVARGGTDRTVIANRWSGRVRIVHDNGHADTMITTGHVAKLLREKPYGAAAIDVTGVGAGVFDRLREQNQHVTAFVAAGRAHDRSRFLNRRAEVYWELRQAFENGEIDIDPHDDELAAQLGAIKWSVTSAGQIKIESKDDMRRRGLPSPDRADAVVIAWSQGRTVDVMVDEEAMWRARALQRADNTEAWLSLRRDFDPPPW